MPSGANANRFFTGNEYLSLAGVSTETGAVNGVGFVHSGFRACVEIKGSENSPFLEPIVEVDGQSMLCEDSQSELLDYWVPRIRCSSGDLEVTYTLFAPMERRGLVGVLSAKNGSSTQTSRLRLGWKAAWARSVVTTKLGKPMFGFGFAYPSDIDPATAVLEFRGHVPLFAVAFTPDDRLHTTIDSAGVASASDWTQSKDPLTVEMASEFELGPGESLELPLYVGVSSKEVSAVACAREMKMHGWERLLTLFRNWLRVRKIDCGNAALDNVLNTSSFACYFGTQANTLDTEQYVLTSSRFTKNPTCGVYSDSDAMLMALPAVLQIDPIQARKMLVYALTCQLVNVGVLSRFIDGVVLEPGLGLDRLCAPIIALHAYVNVTDDLSILYDQKIQTAINTIQGVLSAQRHPEIPLFETLLTPSGNHARQPYLCYSNAIVWQALRGLAELYKRIHDPDRSQESLILAQAVKTAHTEHFTVAGPFGPMFAFSSDLNGNHELGDDLYGSIALLVEIGIYPDSNEACSNTLLWLQSEHNPEQYKRSYDVGTLTGESGLLPSVSLINDLQTAAKSKALAHLADAAVSTSGVYSLLHSESEAASLNRPSPSLAGYMAYALRRALVAKTPVDRRRKLRPATMEALYHPPPTTNFDSRKARL